MAMRFCILGSGSSGNCALLQTGGASVLVDAGFSAKKLNVLLAPHSTSLDGIDAIFLTHEHCDHSAGLTGLARFPHIKVFANTATARAAQAGLRHRPHWQLFETGSAFIFRDLHIDSFSVPHDAADPVGFLFSTGSDGDPAAPRRSLAWLTDLGHAPQHIRERIRHADVLVVEANHCTEMLKADPRRPWSLKQRISGRHGHLSNESARELLESVENPRWRHVFLAHLSRDCNSPATVEKAFARLVGASFGFSLSIVAPGGGTPPHDF